MNYIVYQKLLQLSRRFLTQSQCCSAVSMSSWSKGKFGATDWNAAVSEAERIVGYPTSFMSLRCLLSDELSNVALQMRKLVGTKHPLLKTARRFVFDGSQNQQTRGLLVLLVSKAAGQAPQQEQNSVIENMVSGIYPRQRTLAEIVEMIHTAYLVHKGVVNVASMSPSDGSAEDMEFGNKMATLSGDYLLANASTALAELQDTRVVELIASCIRDQMIAEFSQFRDADGNDILPLEGHSIEDWEKQTSRATGTLMACSCQGAVMLAGHHQDFQEAAYLFGLYMAYAHQLHEELQSVTHPSKEKAISVVGAPVCIHVSQNHDGSRVRELVRQRKQEELRELILSNGADKTCKEICYKYGSHALNTLQHFPTSDAKTALENIVHAATLL